MNNNENVEDFSKILKLYFQNFEILDKSDKFFHTTKAIFLK